MKLRNKLFLSCAALAACATTMVSTTFAWYTSNTVVNATGVSGTTADSGSEMLLISADKGTTWSTSVAAQLTGATEAMVPVAYKNDTGTFTNAKGDATEGGYVTFELWIKNAAPVEGSVDMTITSITNDYTAALPAKPIIESGRATGLGGATGETYTVDMLRVLTMHVKSELVTGGKAATAENAAYDMDSLTAGLTLADDTIKTYSTADAVKYYDAVMGSGKKLPQMPETAATSKFTSNKVNFELNNATSAQKDNYLKLTFDMFLNGWDKACFDAVQNQTFQMGLTFTFVPKQSA